MDPEVAAQLIDGHEDILTKKFEEEQKFFDSIYCPRCDGKVLKEVNVKVNGDQITTQNLARCQECRCLFEPNMGILVEMGNLANIEPDIPIIRQHED